MHKGLQTVYQTLIQTPDEVVRLEFKDIFFRFSVVFAPRIKDEEKGDIVTAFPVILFV